MDKKVEVSVQAILLAALFPNIKDKAERMMRESIREKYPHAEEKELLWGDRCNRIDCVSYEDAPSEQRPHYHCTLIAEVS